MVVALARTLRGPVFFPLRAAAVVYVDLFRGLPLILVLLLLGFGMPSLRLAWLPHSPLFWGCVALILTYGAYVVRGVPGRHRVGAPVAAGGRPVARAVATRRPCGTSWSRRRSAGCCRRCSTTWSSLQQGHRPDLVLGVDLRRGAQRQIETAKTFNYTPYVVAGLLFVLLTIPMTRLTDWVARRQGWTGVGGGVSADRAGDRPPLLQIAGLRKAYGDARRAARLLACRVAEHECVVADRRVRLRQVDPAALRQPARGRRRRHDHVGGQRHHRSAGRRRTRSGPGSASSSSRSTCSRT